MLAAVKVLFVALALTGVAGTGVATGMVPLTKAIDIHEKHLGQNSTMPDQSRQGQQNALNHLMENQERWLSRNVTQGLESNETAETDLD